MRNGFPAAMLVLFPYAGLIFAQPPASENRLPAPVLPSPDEKDLDTAAPPPSITPPRLPGATSGESYRLAPCCQDSCVPCRAACGPEGRFWASAEYLLWWFEGARVPPLVTTSPPAANGVLGAPGTTVLFGDSRLEEDAHSGGRFTLGYWLNDCQTIGLEGGYLFLGSRAADFTAGGSGLPGSQLIARPIVNALTGAETSQLVVFPGALAGTVGISSSSRLEGAGLNTVANLCCSCCSRVDLLAGFRYLELREGLGITENLAVSPTVPTIGGSTLAVADQFDTRNQFYGGQLGARGEYRRGNAFVDIAGSVALGTMHEEVEIQGSTRIAAPGVAPTTSAGGVLALPSNSGRFSRDRFAAVPEIDISAGYQFTHSLRAFVGYTFLYSSNAIRPGDVIDRTVNLSQLPSNAGPGTLTGPARPTVVLKDTEFWAQGISFGLEFRY
jgi:hypothetical protein